MSTQTFNVPNISCGHCVNSIKNELEEIEGVTSVSGDPGSKTITVEFGGGVTEETIRKTLREINYPAE